MSMRFEPDATAPPVLDRDFRKALASEASTPDGMAISGGQLVRTADGRVRHTLTAKRPPAR